MSARTRRPTARRGRIRAAPLALAACLAVGPGAAAADGSKADPGQDWQGAGDPALLVGEWTAVLQDGNYPQPVILRIDRVTPGKTAGKITYSSPRRCVIDLEYGGPHEGRHIFYIIRFTSCFDYETTDFVAIAGVPDPAVERARAREDTRRRRVGSFASLGVGDAGKDAAGAEPAHEQAAAPEPAAAPTDRLTHIRYSVVLGGAERETAVLAGN